MSSRSRLNRPLALLVAGTFFMEILDGTILSTAAPSIAADLGVAPVDVNTAMTGYLIALAAGIPVSGWLTERFGGRRILAVAIAVFTLASIGCALSPSLPVLVAMRIVQGLGGALMVPVGRLVVLRETSKADMLDAIAYLTWPALLAPVIAPTLGGWIVTVASWHWIFLINVPLGVLAFVITLRVVPTARADDLPPLDWWGFLLCAGSLASFLIFIEVLQPQGGLDTVAVLASGLTAAVVIMLSGWWLRRAQHPILRFDALRVRTFAVSNLGGGLYRLVISAVPFLVPLLLQVGLGFSPVLSGTMLLLLFLGNLAIKPATSPLLRRFGFRRVLDRQRRRGCCGDRHPRPDRSRHLPGPPRSAAAAQRRLPLDRLQRLQLAAVRRHLRHQHGRGEHPLGHPPAAGRRSGRGRRRPAAAHR